MTGRFRCTYCDALVPGAVSLADLGLGFDSPTPGTVYPYEKCPCGYGRYARYTTDGERETDSRDRRPPSVLAQKIRAAHYARLPLGAIRPNPHQPRKFFAAEALSGLATSLSRIGQLEDILVRPVGEHFEIVLGERRWRASQMAGLTEISAKVADLDEAEVAEIALAENVQREDLTPVEEAFSFKAYVDAGQPIDGVAARLGVGERVAERLKLLNSHYYITYQEQRINELSSELTRVKSSASTRRYDVAVVPECELPDTVADGFEVVTQMGHDSYLVRRPIHDGQG